MAAQKQAMGHSLLTLLYRESIPSEGAASANAVKWYVLREFNRQKDGQCGWNIVTRTKERGGGEKSKDLGGPKQVGPVGYSRTFLFDSKCNWETIGGF